MKTNQQIFDQVKSHLLAQGAKSMSSQYSHVAGDVVPACAYRGDGGRKCAAGCLIEDRYYVPTLEGATVHVWHVLDALHNSGIEHASRHLVRALQDVHDSKEPNDWPNALRVVAGDYGLIP